MVGRVLYNNVQVIGVRAAESEGIKAREAMGEKGVSYPLRAHEAVCGGHGDELGRPA